MTIREFRRAVYRYYRESPRSFPWREGAGPWGVLVSEFMLQQTQTGRVVDYYLRWMERWPRPEDLAAAPLGELLREWSGLGYNRRARYLRECAAIIAGRYGGLLPRSPEELDALPGIGPYTAGAIACFAWNLPTVFVETNIRSAVIHCFFPEKSGPAGTGPAGKVRDGEILPILEEALDRKDPRTWHYALMDYGAALKKTAANPGRRSFSHARQGRFEGSFRQKRGRALRSLAFDGPAALPLLAERTGLGEEELRPVMAALAGEMLAACEGGVYRIP